MKPDISNLQNSFEMKQADGQMDTLHPQYAFIYVFWNYLNP